MILRPGGKPVNVVKNEFSNFPPIPIPAEWDTATEDVTGRKLGVRRLLHYTNRANSSGGTGP